MKKEQTGISFTGRELRDMIVPLFLEQLLVILVGVADTLVISYAGEAAVSGVSLVNQFNTIFIYLFTALASGGAVIISQYIGSRDTKMAGKASGQLLMFSTVFSLVMGLGVLLGGRGMLGLLFGRVEEDVMASCVTYLRISAYSYPMLAVYNAGAALCRSLGKTRITMNISFVSNIINVVGNLMGVFVLKAGVAGVAWPSLIARTVSALWITVLCFRPQMPVRYDRRGIFCWDGSLLKKMLGIAVPNGIESGVFQLTKVALSSIVALFGTCQIAANGVAQSIWSLAALAGVAMGPVFITVIGQCMGGGGKLWQAAENQRGRLPGMECPDPGPDAPGAWMLQPGAGDKSAGILAGGHPQLLQRPGLSLRRSPGQRPAGSGGREIHHVPVPVYHRGCAAGTVGGVRGVAELGRSGHRRGHVLRLERQRRGAVCKAEKRKMEILPPGLKGKPRIFSKGMETY